MRHLVRFLVPLAAAGLVASGAGCGPESDGDADADSDSDVDGDVDGDADADGDGDVDGDVDGDADGDADEDGEAGPGWVGSACEDRDDCVAPTETGYARCILEEQGYPGGYCTVFECTPDDGIDDCPGDAICFTFSDGFSICMDTCERAADCRPDYDCVQATALDWVCWLPGCSTALDCGPGRQCLNTATANYCYDPAGTHYGPCETRADCPSGDDVSCITESLSGWPGGTCYTLDCTLNETGGTGCPGDGVCADDYDGDGQGYCFDGCATDADCRAGYACVERGPMGETVCMPGCTDDAVCTGGRLCVESWGSCFPPFDATELGAECAFDHDCATGYCLDELSTGYPRGMCIRPGCSEDADCPAGGACVVNDEEAGTGNCWPRCATSAECRAGYACEEAGPDGDLVCAPACTGDTQCEIWRHRCESDTGLCLDEFVSTELGEPCWDYEGCEGGFCLTERAYGMPDGLCVAFGCTLGVPCHGVGVCVDDGDGDGQGICYAGCGTEADCRAGFGCEPYGPGGAGICWAECESSAECGLGFVCNATGLCVHPFDAADLGAGCFVAADCDGGRCLSERGAGYPGGLCVAIGCSVTAQDCPGDGLCIQDRDPDDLGICLDGCAGPGDCRAGYDCADPGGGRTACVPACAEGECRAGFRCDVATGLCRTDATDGNVGDPCAAATACTELAVPVCLPEADYPGGHCTEACDPLRATCPAGSLCRPAAHAGTAYCQVACLTDLDCRTGYACATLEGAGGPAGTCTPL